MTGAMWRISPRRAGLGDMLPEPFSEAIPPPLRPSGRFVGHRAHHIQRYRQRRALPSFAPRLLLQSEQAGTRLVRSLVPPEAKGSR